MTTAKLHINISPGLIDVEGDSELVREIYADFKTHLLSGVTPAALPQDEREETIEPEDNGRPRAKGKRKSAPKKRGAGDEASSGISADAPKLDRDLDTAKLAAFYGQFEPKNHSDKILIFLTFLTQELGIAAPNTDQVYTCYIKANQKPPKAFAQAFRDTSGKSFGYIEYRPPTEIRITTAGNNHFHFDLKKKGDE
ncbi:hypothetical protein [Phyllobacterium sp. UNC302MFCol5.2]|uniref:hypothetical protein n=1 Tax=Phyllobacterium sp. UNC302MFCol5.2 TaxID=1449065 RepID=UPI00047F7D8B|nr:hypothetical protein [Phyllobacterium sp. UNC302MFCol5.2]